MDKRIQENLDAGMKPSEAIRGKKPEPISAYVVCSVKQLRSLLRRAVKDQKKYGNDSDHCVVIERIRVTRIDGGFQINSCDLMHNQFMGEK